MRVWTMLLLVLSVGLAGMAGAAEVWYGELRVTALAGSSTENCDPGVSQLEGLGKCDLYFHLYESGKKVVDTISSKGKDSNSYTWSSPTGEAIGEFAPTADVQIEAKVRCP